METQVECENYQFVNDFQAFGAPTYFPPDSQPRATDSMGWWGAFGHVVIDADYSNIIVTRNNGNSGYTIKTRVYYGVNDDYEWFGGQKGTPLPLGLINRDIKEHFPPVQMVTIPHSWEDSLVAAGRAAEYPFTITWSDYIQVEMSKDFNQFIMMLPEYKVLSLK